MGKVKRYATESENRLWNYLKNGALGVEFVRQYEIGKYLVDFYCDELKLVIEIDGGEHYSQKGLEHDRKRDEFMEDLGIKTIRFTNIEVREDIEEVVITLLHLPQGHLSLRSGMVPSLPKDPK